MKTFKWILFCCLFTSMLFVTYAYNKQTTRRSILITAYNRKYNLPEQRLTNTLWNTLNFSEKKELDAFNQRIYRIELLLGFLTTPIFLAIVVYIIKNHQRFIDWSRKVRGIETEELKALMTSKK